MRKPTMHVAAAVIVALVAAGCGRSPVSPSLSSTAAATVPSAGLDAPQSSRPASNDFCEYPELQVTASTGGAVPDGPSVLQGSFDGTHRAGTMSGLVQVGVSTQVVLRNRQLELIHDHTFTLGEGAFTAGGRSVLRPVRGTPGAFQLNERLPVTAGTKLFTGAEGELRIDGVYDRSAGTMTYRLTGRVCRTGAGWIE